MTKFEFIRNNDKKSGKISTAINNIKNQLLNQKYTNIFLEKQAKKCNLQASTLLEQTLKMIRAENNGILPEFLKKYEK